MGRILLRSSPPILSARATSSGRRPFGLSGRALGVLLLVSHGCGRGSLVLMFRLGGSRICLARAKV